MTKAYLTRSKEERPVEEKWEWMTGYFVVDTSITLTVLEKMGVDIMQLVDNLIPIWPAWDFRTADEAINFVINTYENFVGGSGKLLKGGENEAEGLIKCVVPTIAGQRPKKRGFKIDLKKGEIWCKYWCAYWFQQAAKQSNWLFDVKRGSDGCIWRASRIR